MMQVIADQSHAPLFAAFLDGRMPEPIELDLQRTRFIALVDVPEDRPATLDDILTVCALNRWTPHTCEATLASSGAKRQKATREYITAVFDFVFNHAGRSRLITHVAVDNEKSIAVQHMLGMKQEAVLRDHFGEDRNAVLFGLTKRDWLAGPWALQADEA